MTDPALDAWDWQALRRFQDDHPGLLSPETVRIIAEHTDAPEDDL